MFDISFYLKVRLFEMSSINPSASSNPFLLRARDCLLLCIIILWTFCITFRLSCLLVLSNLLAQLWKSFGWSLLSIDSWVILTISSSSILLFDCLSLSVTSSLSVASHDIIFALFSIESVSDSQLIKPILVRTFILIAKWIQENLSEIRNLYYLWQENI